MSKTNQMDALDLFADETSDVEENNKVIAKFHGGDLNLNRPVGGTSRWEMTRRLLEQIKSKHPTKTTWNRRLNVKMILKTK